MTKYNAANERTKHKYYELKREAKGLSGATIDGIAKALARFEDHTSYQDFRRFTKTDAISFKAQLRCQLGASSGNPLSRSTIHSTLRALEAFFRWLAQQPRFRNHIDPSDVEYFTYLKKDARIAAARRTRQVPSLEEVKEIINLMRSDTEVERRNQALIAFLLVSGARVSAVASLKLGDIDLNRRFLFQDARHVRTKNSKSIESFFFPVGEEIVEILSRWVMHLRFERGFTSEDPLFPATMVVQGTDFRFQAVGVGKKHWSSGDAISRIISAAAASANLPHFTPHAIRSTLGVLGLSLNMSAEELKAYSLNLGHDHVNTTMEYYSPIPTERRRQLMEGLNRPGKPAHLPSDEDASGNLSDLLRDAGLRIVRDA